MRISDWSSDVCSSDLFRCRDDRIEVPCRDTRSHGDTLVGEGLWTGDWNVQGAVAAAGPGAAWPGRAGPCICCRPDLLVEDHRSGHGCHLEFRWRPRAVRITGDGDAGAASEADGFDGKVRSEEHTSELQSLMRHSYAVFC